MTLPSSALLRVLALAFGLVICLQNSLAFQQCNLYLSATKSRSYSFPVLNYVNDQWQGEDSLVTSTTSVLPSLKQVSSDTFTDQTFHASTLVTQLLQEEKEEETELQELLSSQLSHREGMRGFLAVYLTRDHSPQEFPPTLTGALKSANMTLLVPLVCRNVLTATAMASQHTDPILKANSRIVAAQAVRFLTAIRGSIHVIKHTQALHAVASETSTVIPVSTENQLELFWRAVFQESQFDEKQKESIAAAFATFIDESIV